MVVTQAMARGVAGLVVDAGVRDAAEIRGLGFPVWSRAVSAAATRKVSPGWVNVPVVCAGVEVNPGDVVVADDDGVVVVASMEARAVVKAANARVAREDGLRQRYARGESSLDVNGLRPLLVQLGVEYRPADADRSSPGSIEDGRESA